MPSRGYVLMGTPPHPFPRPVSGNSTKGTWRPLFFRRARVLSVSFVFFFFENVLGQSCETCICSKKAGSSLSLRIGPTHQVRRAPLCHRTPLYRWVPAGVQLAISRSKWTLPPSRIPKEHLVQRDLLYGSLLPNIWQSNSTCTSIQQHDFINSYYLQYSNRHCYSSKELAGRCPLLLVAAKTSLRKFSSRSISRFSSQQYAGEAGPIRVQSSCLSHTAIA